MSTLPKIERRTLNNLEALIEHKVNRAVSHEEIARELLRRQRALIEAARPVLLLAEQAVADMLASGGPAAGEIDQAFVQGKIDLLCALLPED
jgi:hypothetical protein